MLRVLLSYGYWGGDNFAIIIRTKLLSPTAIYGQAR